MPKRRRTSRTPERNRRRIARRDQSAPGLRSFDDAWLARFREFSRARYVDLTSVEDRRRWDPNSRWPTPKNVRGLHTRIVVVPEGHKLARHLTYGGRYRLGDLQKRWRNVYQVRDWSERDVYDRHGGKQRVTPLGVRTVPKRIGFHMPWQVIVCVRRKRRREVIHALHGLNRKGGGGRARKLGRRDNRRRTAETEIVC